MFKFRTLCVFDPPYGGLGTTYDVHLGLIGKRVVDFLLVLIELFSLGITAEELRANIGWKSAISLQREPVDLKFQVIGVAPTNHSFSQKTRLNYLSCGIKNLDRSFFRFVTIHAFDRWTDGQTDTFLIAPRWHSMQRGKIVRFISQLYSVFYFHAHSQTVGPWLISLALISYTSLFSSVNYLALSLQQTSPSSCRLPS